MLQASKQILYFYTHTHTHLGHSVSLLTEAKMLCALGGQGQRVDWMAADAEQLCDSAEDEGCCQDPRRYLRTGMEQAAGTLRSVSP